MSRKLSDWVNGFVKYVEPVKAPPLFARWTAISTLASICQRRYWYNSRGTPVYPSLFVILVGGPGVGKGITLAPAIKIMRQLEGINLAADSMTTAALGDELCDFENNIVYHTKNGQVVECVPLTILSKELQVFMPAYDSNMLGRMNSLWDLEGYSERTRKAGAKLESPNAHLNFIAGTTPSFMSKLLPEEAWEGGFMSRCIIAYHGENIVRLFSEEEENENAGLFNALVSDAADIMNDMGQVIWHPETKQLFNDWLLAGAPPKPDHPKMLSYNDRRPWNIARASMLTAIARGRKQILPEDFVTILDLLVATEAAMLDVFKAIKQGTDQEVMREAVHFVFTRYSRAERPVGQQEVLRFLNEKVPSFRSEQILRALTDAGLLVRKHVAKRGYCYVPGELTFD